MAHLALSLLGAFDATLDGVAITTFESARVRALLAYLAVEADRPHTREALAGLLWPDRPERQAHDNLRAALSNLRTALNDRRTRPPFLLISRASLQFNVAGDYQLDVDDFRSAIDDGPPARHESGASRNTTGLGWRESRIANLKAAIHLYHGPFLHDFSVPSIEFEAWQLLRQEELEHRFLTGLQRRQALQEAQGEYEPALAHARRHLQLVPWDESAHRRAMRLLALTGRRGAALAQYEACRRVLAAEFGIEPAPETAALYEQIREGKISQPREPGPAIGALPSLHPARGDPEGTSTPLFVGRDRELAALDAHLAHALAGHGRVVLVRGEAGSGKTALLSAFARRALAAHANLVVAAGSGSARLEQGDPYLPFREILQLLTGDVAARRAGWALPVLDREARRLWDLLPVSVYALVMEGPNLVDRLLPGAALALRAEAFAPGGAAWRSRLEALLREQQNRFTQPAPALVEQTSHVLLAIARRRPLLLLLDDLQWADAASLNLLFHLGRLLAWADDHPPEGESRLLMVGAYRPHDLRPDPDGAPHPLRALVRALRRHFGEMEVDLEQAAGRPFVDALLDAEPNALDEAFRARLSLATGGHALFTVELLRELQERGSLMRDEAGRWVLSAGPALDWGRLPARVDAVIGGRLDRLPAHRLALLSAAGVAGETFSAEVLARALDLPEAHVLAELNGPLSHSHLVYAHGLVHLDNGQRLSHYRFRHALFQSYVYGQLNAVERAQLHEAVGTALETLYGEDATGVAAQLAWHFEAAGLVEKAVDYLLLAGRQAHRLSASQEAIDLYRRALSLLETRPDSDERARRELDLHLALSETLPDMSGWGHPEQVAVLAHAARLSQRLGEPARLLPMLQALYKLRIAQGKHKEALALARQISGLAEQTRDFAYVVAGRYLTGLSYFFLGDVRPACEEMEEALARSRTRPPVPPDPASGARAEVDLNLLFWLSVMRWMLGYPEQALSASRAALAAADELFLTQAQALDLVVSTSGIAFHALCHRIEDVQACTEWLARLIDEKHLLGYRPWVRFYEGWLLVHQKGARAEGVAQMRATMPSIQAIRPYRLMLLGEACMLAEQLDAAQEALDEALALVSHTGARSCEAEMHRLHGQLLLKKNGSEREDAAETCFRQAIAVAQRQETKSWELRATLSLARLWAGRGRTDAAQTVLAAVYGWFTEGFETPDLVAARALLAELGEAQPGR
jgi:DNA-binding SARP family transcriptional activator